MGERRGGREGVEKRNHISINKTFVSLFSTTVQCNKFTIISSRANDVQWMERERQRERGGKTMVLKK